MEVGRRCQKEIDLVPGRVTEGVLDKFWIMAHFQLNVLLLLTVTLTYLITLTSTMSTTHLLGPDTSPQNSPDYYGEGVEEGEEDKLEIKEVVEFRSRNKRYPIHLDPHYGSHYKFQSGECPKSADGQTKFFCPFPHRQSGRYICIEDWELCNGVKNCPNAEDETPSNCLFYKVMQSQINGLVASQTEREEEQRRAKSLREFHHSFH